jgi:hypothetical protein
MSLLYAMYVEGRSHDDASAILGAGTKIDWRLVDRPVPPSNAPVTRKFVHVHIVVSMSGCSKSDGY